MDAHIHVGMLIVMAMVMISFIHNWRKLMSISTFFVTLDDVECKNCCHYSTDNYREDSYNPKKYMEKTSFKFVEMLVCRPIIFIAAYFLLSKRAFNPYGDDGNIRDIMYKEWISVVHELCGHVSKISFSLSRLIDAIKINGISCDSTIYGDQNDCNIDFQIIAPSDEERFFSTFIDLNRTSVIERKGNDSGGSHSFINEQIASLSIRNAK